MPETAHGIVYPESTDHTRLWEHYQNLAESTDELFNTIPFIQFGHATISPASSNSGDAKITYPTPFAATPVVVVELQSRAIQWYTGASSVTATGCNLWVAQRDGTASSANLTVAWIAIGTAAA